jgi:hypothetical protein
LQQYRFWVEQARRLPIDMASRYRVAAVRWRSHDTGGTYPYARAILAALNVGDSSGSGYNQSVDRLDALDDLLSGVPADLQRRLATIYGSVSSLFWLAGAFDGARKPVRYQRDGARSSISSTCGWSGSGPMRSSLSACVNRSRTSEAVIGEHQGAGRRAMPRQSTPSCLAYDRRSGRAEQ